MEHEAFHTHFSLVGCRQCRGASSVTALSALSGYTIVMAAELGDYRLSQSGERTDKRRPVG